MRFLVIDSDHNQTSSIPMTLRWAARATTVAPSVEEGIALGVTEPFPDLIILDLALSEGACFRVLRLLRAGSYSGPILVASGSTNEGARVQAFRLGANQYMAKPFGALELLARVDSLTSDKPRARIDSAPSQRAEMRGNGTGQYTFGSVVVEPSTHRVSHGGKPVKLAPLEFDLLMALLRRHGAAVTRGELLREVWKYGPDVRSRTLDTHILNLRAKLEDEPSAPSYILTVRKLGYRLDR